VLPAGASRCFPVEPPCFPVARRRRMFHPPANAPHGAVAYRTTALDARRQTGPADRAGFLKYIYSTIVKLSRIIILISINYLYFTRNLTPIAKRFAPATAWTATSCSSASCASCRALPVCSPRVVQEFERG
jgi:hypothetical protein